MEWIKVKIGDRKYFHLETGSTPSTSEKSYWGGDIVWVTPKDLGKSKQKEIRKSERMITKEGLAKSSTSLIPQGAIIISTRAPIGYVAIAGVELCFNQGCKAIVSKNTLLLSDYLYYATLSVVSEMKKLGKGATFAEISKAKLESIELLIPFKDGKPDLAEQKRIAKKLDCLFMMTEQGEGKTKRGISLAGDLFGSYLNNLFDVKNQEEFQEIKLGSLCAIAGGSGFPHSHQGRKTEKYPFYKVGDMNTEGNEVYMIKHNHSISDEDVKNLKVRIYPAGTIIFPKIGGAIATNKKRILSVPSAVDNNVMALAPNKDVCPEYLYSYFLNFNLSDWPNKAALPSIRKSDVEKTLVPIPMKDKNPNYSLQKQLAENIKTFQEKTLSVSHLSKKSLETLGRFRQSVLSDAFFHST